ncbi:hypothetical protein AMECASPLE_036184 [Ameca splendens]|uniref:Secreted protein n=1 Tax=Ameca splendens TaxID=208324 RepID=A0ABV0ZGP2_9TELE
MVPVHVAGRLLLTIVVVVLLFLSLGGGEIKSLLVNDPNITTMPTTVPKGKTPAKQAEGRHRKATACTTKRPHSPTKMQNHQQPCQTSKNDRAKPWFPLSQHHTSFHTSVGAG